MKKKSIEWMLKMDEYSNIIVVCFYCSYLFCLCIAPVCLVLLLLAICFAKNVFFYLAPIIHLERHENIRENSDGYDR